MKNILFAAGLLGLILPVGATSVYSNTTTDTLTTVVYSVNAYTEIGDQLSLASTERAADDATTQFFNVGDAGTFDATLRFFLVGAPVGSQIGGDFTLTGLSIASFDILNVNWLLGGLVLPDNVIFTVSVANETSGVDVGLDRFDPPTVGTSDNTFFISRSGTYSTQDSLDNQDNIYFDLNASQVQVPEPGTILLMLAGIPALAALRRRFR